LTSALSIERELLWKVAGDEELVWRTWEGDCIVYHPLSGDTQLLDVSIAEVLRQVSISPRTHADLCQRLAEFLDVGDDPELAKAVTQILGKLDDLGIIEPTEP